MRHEIQSALESLINRSNSVVTIILDYSSSLAIIFKRFQNLLFTVIITRLFYIRYFFFFFFTNVRNKITSTPTVATQPPWISKFVIHLQALYAN